MKVNEPLAAPMGSVDPAEPLRSRAVVALTGLSYGCVGLALSYVDRRHGTFGLESFLWMTWTLLGFGAGCLHVHKRDQSGYTQWVVLGSLGMLLAVPALVLYSPVRLFTLMLMVVMGARAAMLRTRRDFYFMLSVVIVESFVAVTNAFSDWTLWVYLGPAWVFGALALAWEHAAGVPLSRWTKAAMTAGFMGLSVVLAAALFFWLPRPPLLGFGFLPPGSDAPGLFSSSSEGRDGSAESGQGGPAGGGTGFNGQGQGQGAPSQPGDVSQKWADMLKYMRQALSDPSIPRWQHSLMMSGVSALQGLHQALNPPPDDAGDAAGDAPPTPSSSTWGLALWMLLALLALLLVAFWLWRRRYRIGVGGALLLSGLVAGRAPMPSMRLSAQAMTWCLHLHGVDKTAGQSVREHWSSAARIPPLARRWLGFATESYGQARFSGGTVSTQQALHMRQAVCGACDILAGIAPELRQ